MNFVMEKFSKMFQPNVDVVGTRSKNPIPPLTMTKALDAYTAYLHEEMRQAYLQGLDHAAIVVACSLLEYAIKSSLYYEEFVKAGHKFSQGKWDEIEAKEFGEVINWAKRSGLISKEEHKRLESFRKAVRNFYMHGSTPDQVKRTVLPTYVGDLRSGDVQKDDIDVATNLPLQRIVRIAFDRQQCDSVVRFVDMAVRKVLDRKDARIAEAESTNKADSPTDAQFKTIIDKLTKAGVHGMMAIGKELPDIPNELGESE